MCNKIILQNLCIKKGLNGNAAVAKIKIKTMVVQNHLLPFCRLCVFPRDVRGCINKRFATQQSATSPWRQAPLRHPSHLSQIARWKEKKNK